MRKLSTSKLAFTLLMQILTCAYLSVFTFIIFIQAIKIIFTSQTFQFDLPLMQFFYSLRTPLLTQLMLTLSFLGGQIFTVSCLIFVSIILILRGHKKTTLLFAFLLSTNGILILILKELIHRPRPQLSPLLTESSYSFPSGHAMNALVLSALFIYLIFHFTRSRRYTLSIILLCLLLTSLIGISRVYLGVHFPSDILAGYLAGLCWLATFTLIYKIRKLFKLL